MFHGHHTNGGENSGDGVWWFLFAIGSLAVAYFAMRIVALRNDGSENKDEP